MFDTAVSTSIAILLPNLKFGGAEKVALSLARALAAEGVQVEFLLMSRQGEFLEAAEREFPVVDLACRRTWQLPLKLMAYTLRRRPVAILSSFWKLNVCACVARLAAPRTRLLLWEHSQPSRSANSPTLLYGFTSSILYRLSTRVICVSSGVRDDILSITLGLRRKLSVILNPIPPPVDANVANRSMRTGRNVVWVGRLDEPKNPLLALESWALMAQQERPMLRFIGDGPLRSVLEDRCRELGLAHCVEFLGFQPAPQQWMLTADVLLLTSNREGMGNVLVEALQCGLGIVVTDCNLAIRELLDRERHGRIVPKGDARAVATAVLAELAHPRLFEAQVSAAIPFEPRTVALQFLSIVSNARRV